MTDDPKILYQQYDAQVTGLEYHISDLENKIKVGMTDPALPFELADAKAALNPMKWERDRLKRIAESADEEAARAAEKQAELDAAPMWESKRLEMRANWILTQGGSAADFDKAWPAIKNQMLIDQTLRAQNARLEEMRRRYGTL